MRNCLRASAEKVIPTIHSAQTSDVVVSKVMMWNAKGDTSLPHRSPGHQWLYKLAHPTEGGSSFHFAKSRFEIILHLAFKLLIYDLRT